MTKWWDCVCVWERPCHLCRVLSYINVSARQPEGLAADYFLSAHASNAASSCQELFSCPPFLFHPFWDNNILTAAEWSVAMWGGLPRPSKRKKKDSLHIPSPHLLILYHLNPFSTSLKEAICKIDFCSVIYQLGSLCKAKHRFILLLVCIKVSDLCIVEDPG